MNFTKDYILRISENPKTAKKLIKLDYFPIRRLEIDLSLMNVNEYDKNFGLYGEDKFKQISKTLNDFPKGWVELNSGQFYTPDKLSPKGNIVTRLGLSKKQFDLVRGLSEDLEPTKLEVSYDEFFDTVKDFSKDGNFHNFKDFLNFANPFKVGVVTKKYFNEDLRLELQFNNIRYSKNA